MSKPTSICKNRLLVKAALILILVTFESEGVGEYPIVQILKWMTTEETLDWQYGQPDKDSISVQDGHTETVYTVAQHVDALVLSCNASYPVQWTFNHYDRVGLYNLRTKTYRWATDIFNVNTFKFSAELYLYSANNDLTGAYSCERATDESTTTNANNARNNVYIYWLGDSPPYLLHAGKTVTVKSADNKTLVLPCVVSKPDVQVSLWRHTSEMGNYSLLEKSDAISYSPRIGFTIDLEKLAEPFTTYKCTVVSADDGDGREDQFFMTALPGLDTRFQKRNRIEGNATFSYDEVTREIKCCSISGRAPNIRTEFCDNALTCKLRESVVMAETGNNGVRSRNSSCTVERIYYRESGVLKCKGDGIDILRHFFSKPRRFLRPMNQTDKYPVYFNWEEADPTTLVDVRPLLRLSTPKIYTNQSMLVNCDVSRYYFSDGLQWMLTWKNGSRQFLNESFSAYKSFYYGLQKMQTIRLKTSLEMANLTCFAPVWNNTQWIQKTFELNVSEPTPPSWTGTNTEQVELSLNQVNKTTTCTVTSFGDPPPAIWWKKNDRVLNCSLPQSPLTAMPLKNDSNTLVVFKKGVNGSAPSSSITFRNVTLDVHGDYICVAQNIGGSAEKTFRVSINLPGSSVGTWTLLLIGLVILCLGAGVAFLFWKSRGQRAIIQYLTGVVFKDVDPPMNQENCSNGRMASRTRSNSIGD